MAVITRANIIADAKKRAGRKSQGIDSTALGIAFDSILQKMTEDFPLLRNICHPFTTVASQSWISLPSDYRSWEQCFYDDNELGWMEPEWYFYLIRAQTDTAGTPREFTIAEDESRLYLWNKPSTATASYFYYAAIHPKVEKTLAFISGGTYEVKRGDTVTGATSAKTMVVNFVRVTSGSWSGGDAAGFLLGTPSGTMQAENLNVGANLNVATISADATTADNFQHFLSDRFDEVIIEGLAWKILELIDQKQEALVKKSEFELLLASKAGRKLRRKLRVPGNYF